MTESRAYSTNYANAFIKVATDCAATTGQVPSKPGTIAALQHQLLSAAPYAMTSDDLLFEVHARRHDVPPTEREAARDAFFAKPQACLRASPLVKTFGWGLHHDAQSRVALIGVETAAYHDLSERPDLAIVPGMRSRRA